MFLSRLLINVGDNPDRPRPGRLWLRNLYHVHQRLCMAFPSNQRILRDPDFLAPYDPQDFPEQRHLADRSKLEVDADILKQVHARRNQNSGFLFRIDPLPRGRAMILVQSAAWPDWDYAFHNAAYLLAACEVKLFNPDFTKDQSLRFRLLANPTKRFSKHSLEADGQLVQEKWIGKRVPVRNEQLFEWLACRAEKSGFSVNQNDTQVQPGYIYVHKKKMEKDKGQRLRSVRYDGVLQVTDPDGLRKTVIQGLGPGKAFGFGLLSLAPCQNSPPGEAP
jgi:CRISPR system Cascade subunit CasE